MPCGPRPGGRQDGPERAPGRRRLGTAECCCARPGSAARRQLCARAGLRRRGSQRACRNSDRAAHLVPRARSRCWSARTVARPVRVRRSPGRVAPLCAEPGRPGRWGRSIDRRRRPDLRLGRREDDRLVLVAVQPEQEQSANRDEGSKAESACREEQARPVLLVLRRRHQYTVIRWSENETLCRDHPAHHARDAASGLFWVPSGCICANRGHLLPLIALAYPSGAAFRLTNLAFAAQTCVASESGATSARGMAPKGVDPSARIGAGMCSGRAPCRQRQSMARMFTASVDRHRAPRRERFASSRGVRAPRGPGVPRREPSAGGGSAPRPGVPPRAGRPPTCSRAFSSWGWPSGCSGRRVPG